MNRASERNGSNHPNENTIICRCEDISLADVRRLLDRGYTTIDEIRRLSRAGMGPCQGKTCRLLLLQELARATGRPPGDVALGTFRPPTKPFKLGILVDEDEDTGDKGGASR